MLFQSVLTEQTESCLSRHFEVFSFALSACCIPPLHGCIAWLFKFYKSKPRWCFFVLPQKCWCESPVKDYLSFWACCCDWREGKVMGALKNSPKWKTNNRFFSLALSCALSPAGSLASGLCWCVAQQQSEVIISLAVSIRFNFSSRLHLPESLDCVTLHRQHQWRAAESFYLSKRSRAKGKRSAHVFRDADIHRPLVPRLSVHSASLLLHVYMYLFLGWELNGFYPY